MQSPESGILPGAQNKINEYVERINAGESADAVLDGLPPSFRSAVENKLKQSSQDQQPSVKKVALIPPQYKGLTAEALEFIWDIPEYIDPVKTKELQAQKATALAYLREQEARQQAIIDREQNDQVSINALLQDLDVHIEQPTPTEEPEALVATAERKKMHGWEASYELAKVAKQEGIDLSKISREEYVNFAIAQGLAIDDSQLRAAPWQRMATSVQEIVEKNKELQKSINPETDAAFQAFTYEMQQVANTENRYLEEGVRVRQGTKDSNSWLFFGIGEGTLSESTETYKSYISLKDLNTFSPEEFKGFMSFLKQSGYQGDIKIFQDMSGQGIRLNDQIVMHGNSEADAKLALSAAEKFFGEKLDHKSMGKDEVIDGKNRSYSEVLAMRIKEVVKGK